MTVLQCGDKCVDLSAPKVMGVLNVTPDSFSDGGRFNDVDRAVAQAWKMVEEGAAIIDIGGESTRPGAEEVSVDDEIGRVVPVIEALHSLPVPISIDTSKAEVMKAAIAAGARLINDVNGLQGDGALAVAVEASVPVCLMHMQHNPRVMQRNPSYSNVVDDVWDYLYERARCCEEAGVEPHNIVLDPGFGFGKTLAHNVRLFQKLEDFAGKRYPTLIGVSRKSMVGSLIDANKKHNYTADRDAGSLALATLAGWQGVNIVRTHSVKATVDALAVVQTIRD